MSADFTKIMTDDQNEVNRLIDFADTHFNTYQPRNHNYIGFQSANKEIRFEFRKVFVDGELIGFRHVEVFLSPHYHFNDYQHNANDFTPRNAINTFLFLFDYLGISADVYDLYKVVVIEFGLNIIPELNAEKIIGFVAFYQRTKFKTEKAEDMYFKVSNTDRTKEWKIYFKGLQYPEIHPNMLRIEMRLKKQRTISQKAGINHIGDLLKLESYDRLFSAFINDFDNVFFCEDVDFFENLKTEIKETKNRNKWNREKGKYLKNRPHLNATKSKIKGQLIDKFLSFSKSAISPHRIPINKRKLQNEITNLFTVKCETAPSRLCKITKLDISMQKKDSKFINEVGFNFYKQNEPQTYADILHRFWTPICKGKKNKELHKEIAHNIRNTYNNSMYRRPPKNQLQLFT